MRVAALLGAVSIGAISGAAGASTVQSAARRSVHIAHATAGTGMGRVDKSQITVAFDDTPDVGAITVLAAMQEMRRQGYNVKEDILNGPATVADAVQTGGAQIGTMNGISLFKAVVSGSPFVMFAERYSNEIALVTKSSISSVSQLNGATIGVESPTASSTSLMLYTERALHVHVNLIYQPGSAARTAALLTGQLDGSPLELDDVVKILGTDPSKFHVLINFDKEFPWLLGNVLFASRSYIAKHRSVVQAFATDIYSAGVAAYGHPLSFIKKWGHLLTGYTSQVLNATMVESAQQKIWGVDGTIQAPDVARTIAFDQQNGLLTSSQAKELQSTLALWFYPSFSLNAAHAAKGKK